MSILPLGFRFRKHKSQQTINPQINQWSLRAECQTWNIIIIKILRVRAILVRCRTSKQLRVFYRNTRRLIIPGTVSDRRNATEAEDDIFSHSFPSSTFFYCRLLFRLHGFLTTAMYSNEKVIWNYESSLLVYYHQSDRRILHTFVHCGWDYTEMPS